MKALIYARVSSKEQEETGYSLDAQIKLLEEYATKNEFTLDKRIFRLTESASGHHVRKAFNEMLDYATKNEIKVILCEKIDRLTRNLKDATIANDWVQGDGERSIHFVKESMVVSKDAKAHENLMWNMKVALAAFYTSNLSEEVKKGQREKLSQGWLPTKPPFGYKTVGDKGKKVHVIDEATAPFVRALFERYATGLYSIEKLAGELYREGFRSRTGSKVVKGRIHDLMFDPFYYGKMRWLGKIYQGAHEPLISKELFETVGRISSGRTTPLYSKHLYLFKGLIKCTECNGTITWEVQKGITYGHCNQYRECTKRPYYIESDLNEQVSKVFKTLQIKSERLAAWIKQALQESHASEVEYRVNTIKSLQNTLARTQQRLDNLYNDRLDDRVDTATYDKKSTELRAEKENLESEIKRHDTAGDKQKELCLSVFELSQKAEEIYKVATMDEKRKLMSLIFETMLIDRGVLKFTYSPIFDVLATAVLETNCSKEAESIPSPISIFELLKDSLEKEQTGTSVPVYPIWLARWYEFRTMNFPVEMNMDGLI